LFLQELEKAFARRLRELQRLDWAPAITFNPTLSTKVIEQALAADPYVFPESDCRPVRRILWTSICISARPTACVG
jgi:hypothetical protein